MTSEKIKLSEIVRANPSSWSKNLGWSHIRYLDTANITEGRINEIVSFDTQEDKIPSRARRIVENGDVIYSTVRPNQLHYGIIKGIPENLLVSTGFVVLRNKKPKEYDLRYIYHLITQKNLTEYLHGVAENNTSAYPSLKPEDITNLEFHFPSLGQQRSVSDFVELLDDKVENNRRMNETLEEMTLAIFKSWFVDFDPVHAKAAGNAPAHMDTDTAALFPNSFGDDGLPLGWKKEHLPNLIDFKEGPGIRNWQYTNSDEGVRFINIRCIKNKDLELTAANRVTELEAYGKYSHFLLEAGDIVVSTSGTLGRFSFVRQEHLPLMLNTSVIRMRPISNKSTREFLYGYLGSKEFQNELEIRASGSVQKNFGPIHLNQMHLNVPNFKIIKAYSDQVGVIIEKFLFNQKENKTLAELRDTLLPKLMSGEIRVKDAEHQVGEAV